MRAQVCAPHALQVNACTSGTEQNDSVSIDERYDLANFIQACQKSKASCCCLFAKERTFSSITYLKEDGDIVSW
jgi:hypothetical protein